MHSAKILLTERLLKIEIQSTPFEEVYIDKLKLKPGKNINFLKMKLTILFSR